MKTSKIKVKELKAELRHLEDHAEIVICIRGKDLPTVTKVKKLSRLPYLVEKEDGEMEIVRQDLFIIAEEVE